MVSRNKPVLRIILGITKISIDCPVEIIRILNTLHLTRRKKALYYKVLFQETSYIYTLGQMYVQYFVDQTVSMADYSRLEKKFVYKCNYSDIPCRELYKWEYLKNTSRQ